MPESEHCQFPSRMGSSVTASVDVTSVTLHGDYSNMSPVYETNISNGHCACGFASRSDSINLKSS